MLVFVNPGSNITLPGVQADLAHQLLADLTIASKVVVVLSIRGALAIDSIKAAAPAILLALPFVSTVTH